MKTNFKRIAATLLSLSLVLAFAPLTAWAEGEGGTGETPGSETTDPAAEQPSEQPSEQPAEQPEVVDPYSKVPTITYKVVEVSKKKAKTFSDAKQHAFSKGLGKINIAMPKSAVDGSKLEGSLTYKLWLYQKGEKNASKPGVTLGRADAGTIAQAFKLKLKGKIDKHFDAYYRVKVSGLGWMDWAHDGAWAGTSGQGIRLKGIQIKLVENGASAPGATEIPYTAAPTVKYRLNKLDGSWTGYKSNGATAGKTNYKAGSEQIQASVKSVYSGGIKYSVLKRKGGWTKYTTGDAAGDTGKSKQIQAFKMKLTGQLAKKYDVYYRAYSSDHTWMGWAKNGQKAGTQGIKYPMGAIQVKLVAKKQGAPGYTSGRFSKKLAASSGQLNMLRKAQRYSSPTSWLILLNVGGCRVAIFRGEKGAWKIDRWILCSPGAPGTPTVRGTYYVGGKSYVFGNGFSCYYATEIYGNYLFHSVLYNQGTRTIQDGTLGAHVSHGCVRMAINNAKYIYDNVPSGTKIISYN